MANKRNVGRTNQQRIKTSKAGKTNWKSGKGSWIGRAAHDVLSTETKSVGKYAQRDGSRKGYLRNYRVNPTNKQAYKLEKMVQGRISKGSMTAKQRFKLEREAVRNEAMKISKTPEVIRAIGQSVAMNTAGPAAGYTTASIANSTVNKLTSGGANITTIGGKEPKPEERDDDVESGYTSKEYDPR